MLVFLLPNSFSNSSGLPPGVPHAIYPELWLCFPTTKAAGTWSSPTHVHLVLKIQTRGAFPPRSLYTFTETVVMLGCKSTFNLRRCIGTTVWEPLHWQWKRQGRIACLLGIRNQYTLDTATQKILTNWSLYTLASFSQLPEEGVFPNDGLPFTAFTR